METPTTPFFAHDHIYLDGAWVLPHGQESIDVIHSTTEEVMGRVPAGTAADIDRARRVARRLRTGQVEINGGKFNLLAPFGGYKQSGKGRELGRYGLEEFLAVKSLLC